LLILNVVPCHVIRCLVAKLIIALFVVCFDVVVSHWSLFSSLVVVRRLRWSSSLSFVSFVGHCC